MNSPTLAYIAYITGRLISGKRIATLYDFSLAEHVDIHSLPDVEYIKAFDRRYRDYLPGYASGCRAQFACSGGRIIDLSINGTAFMGHITGSSAFFIGAVRGDSIYIFDHEKSEHVNYRISGCMIDSDERPAVCSSCWLGR